LKEICCQLKIIGGGGIMKKIFIILTIVISVFSFSIEKEIPYEKFEELTFEKVNYIISQVKEDIDNDIITENIMLIGEISSETPFVQNIKLVISNREETFILYKNAIPDGYNPYLELADFDGDGIQDILVKNSTGGSGGYINVKLLSFNGTYLEELFSTENTYFNLVGNFKEGFFANLKMDDYFSYDINLSHKKDMYIEEGFYTSEGKIANEWTDLMIGGIGEFEVKKWGDKTIAHVSKSVSGFYHADRIGYVEFLLDFTDKDMKIETINFSIILY
jgi:hypothetical protein